MTISTNSSWFENLCDGVMWFLDVIFVPDIAYAASFKFLSPKARTLLKNLEGLRLFPYDDGDGKAIISTNHKYKGYPTIGYGHLLSKEEVTEKLIKEGWTLIQADEALTKDLARFEHNLSMKSRRELNQNQTDACLLFMFNIGINAFNTSTLLRLINQGKFKEAAGQFERWVYTNGKKSEGLLNRRKKEKALFLGEI